MLASPTGPVVTASEMRAAEEAVFASGTPVGVVMDRAGAAVAEAAWRYGAGHSILVLCGPGNNGGDGYVAARLLRERGASVRVAALREPRAPAAVAARQSWSGEIEPLDTARPAPVVIDALFGTGLARPLEPETRTHLDRLSASARFVLAVDLPSGVGTDDGADLGAIGASMTLALGALKPAHLLQPAAALCGAVRIADIGVPVVSGLTVVDRPKLSAPDAQSHKYRRGYAVVAGGAMGGAAMLAARAAMRLAGYVAITGARRLGPDALVHRRWNDVASDRRVGALLIGPGLGRDDTARAALAAALETSHALVLDADALMLATPADVKARARATILTPHEGEFAAMFPGLSGSKLVRARAAAEQSGAVILLKGADTVIAAPDGRAKLLPPLPGWLASAGTGDVLAGLAVAALAGSGDAFDAATTAAWLHGEAARLAGPALIADDLPAFVAGAIARCL